MKNLIFTTHYIDGATKEQNDAAWEILLDTHGKNVSELVEMGYTMKQINIIIREREWSHES